MRVLVSQLSNVGRDVRATSMQWAYEGKKLDSAVKHMSWVPPWVEGGGAVAEPVGRRFMGPDSVTVQPGFIPTATNLLSTTRLFSTDARPDLQAAKPIPDLPLW